MNYILKGLTDFSFEECKAKTKLLRVCYFSYILNFVAKAVIRGNGKDALRYLLGFLELNADEEEILLVKWRK